MFHFHSQSTYGRKPIQWTGTYKNTYGRVFKSHISTTAGQGKCAPPPLPWSVSGDRIRVSTEKGVLTTPLHPQASISPPCPQPTAPGPVSGPCDSRKDLGPHRPASPASPKRAERMWGGGLPLQCSPPAPQPQLGGQPGIPGQGDQQGGGPLVAPLPAPFSQDGSQHH